MIDKAFTLLVSTALLFLPQLCQANKLLDMLNAEANASITKKIPEKPTLKNSKNLVKDGNADDIRIMDKVAAKDSAYLPKNKNEIEYRSYLKDKYYKTYMQYLKLSLIAREHVYEQYAKSSFPRIENTQEAINQYLKSSAKIK